MRVHMKNGRARRTAFRAVDTKRELLDQLADHGFKFEVSGPRNVGEWNEHRDFFATKEGEEPVWLDRAGKGDRRDWQGMWNHFCDTRGLARD